jgi:hypothetical protein
MDDFTSGHDPASKPLNKNHTPSLADRYVASFASSITSKSSNSERIRLKRDFVASALDARNAIPQPQSALIATPTHACDEHEDRTWRRTHTLASCEDLRSPAMHATRLPSIMSSGALLLERSVERACLDLTCWQVDSRRAHTIHDEVYFRHARERVGRSGSRSGNASNEGARAKGGRASTTLAMKPHIFHRNNQTVGRRLVQPAATITRGPPNCSPAGWFCCQTFLA